MDVSLGVLSRKLRTKVELYDMLSGIYYLPAHNCHAVSVKYLKGLTLANHNIFKVKLKDVTIFKHKNHRNDVETLLAYLEDLLERLNKPPLGFAPGCMPNYDWVANVILHLESADVLSVRSLPPSNSDVDATIALEPE